MLNLLKPATKASETSQTLTKSAELLRQSSIRTLKELYESESQTKSAKPALATVGKITSVRTLPRQGSGASSSASVPPSHVEKNPPVEKTSVTATVVSAPSTGNHAVPAAVSSGVNSSNTAVDDFDFDSLLDIINSEDLTPVLAAVSPEKNSAQQASVSVTDVNGDKGQPHTFKPHGDEDSEVGESDENDEDDDDLDVPPPNKPLPTFDSVPVAGLQASEASKVEPKPVASSTQAQVPAPAATKVEPKPVASSTQPPAQAPAVTNTLPVIKDEFADLDFSNVTITRAGTAADPDAITLFKTKRERYEWVVNNSNETASEDKACELIDDYLKQTRFSLGNILGRSSYRPQLEALSQLLHYMWPSDPAKLHTILKNIQASHPNNDAEDDLAIIISIIEAKNLNEASLASNTQILDPTSEEPIPDNTLRHYQAIWCNLLKQYPHDPYAILNNMLHAYYDTSWSQGKVRKNKEFLSAFLILTKVDTNNPENSVFKHDAEQLKDAILTISDNISCDFDLRAICEVVSKNNLPLAQNNSAAASGLFKMSLFHSEPKTTSYQYIVDSLSGKKTGHFEIILALMDAYLNPGVLHRAHHHIEKLNAIKTLSAYGAFQSAEALFEALKRAAPSKAEQGDLAALIHVIEANGLNDSSQPKNIKAATVGWFTTIKHSVFVSRSSAEDLKESYKEKWDSFKTETNDNKYEMLRSMLKAYLGRFIDDLGVLKDRTYGPLVNALLTLSKVELGHEAESFFAGDAKTLRDAIVGFKNLEGINKEGDFFAMISAVEVQFKDRSAGRLARRGQGKK
ncbi:MAG: SPOR domain-containing protein [Gammaproteobacteria bacterium]